jgi:hypothetical protein
VPRLSADLRGTDEMRAPMVIYMLQEQPIHSADIVQHCKTMDDRKKESI